MTDQHTVYEQHCYQERHEVSFYTYNNSKHYYSNPSQSLSVKHGRINPLPTIRNSLKKGRMSTGS